MANITATGTTCAQDKEKAWTFTEADTPVKTPIFGGRYTLAVEGVFGGGSVEFQFAKGDGTTPYSIDSTNLSFDAAGAYNVELGSGYIVPVRTGGTGMSVTAYLIPIP